MIRDEKAEARLTELARSVVKETGEFDDASDITLIQAFMVFNLSEPLIQNLSSKEMYDKYGFLGLLLLIFFGKKFTKAVQEVNTLIEYHKQESRDMLRMLKDEISLRDRLLEKAHYNERHIQFEASAEAKGIRNKASQVATKIRDKTVEQLRDLLRLTEVRLLEEKRTIAVAAQMTEEVTKLDGQLSDAWKQVFQRLGDMDELLKAKKDFDALIATSDKKSTNIKTIIR